jgi:Ca2+-binding RTX toxin-like protein
MRLIGEEGGVEVEQRHLPTGIALALALLLSSTPGNGQVTPPACGSSLATIVGTDRDDVLDGTPGDDVIVGLGGRDQISGGDGNDTICGGDGDDSVLGGPGNDTIDTGPGADGVSGGLGDDQMTGGDGTDLILFFEAHGVTASLDSGKASGEGDDTLSGFEGLGGSSFEDDLTGDDETNYIFGLGGDDHVHGRGGLDIAAYLGPVDADLETGRSFAKGGVPLDEGSDTLDGVEGLGGISGSTLSGSARADYLFFGSTMNGRGGDDAIFGDNGEQSIDGGPGSDLLVGGGGKDTLDGGAGEDLVSYWASPAPVHADLARGSAQGEGDDTLVHVESVSGSAMADTLIGDKRPNSLYGNGGDDTELSGGAGDDFLSGGDGSDSLDGGKGSDYCVDGERRASCEVWETNRAETSRSAPSRRTSASHATETGMGRDTAGALARLLALASNGSCRSRRCSSELESRAHAAAAFDRALDAATFGPYGSAAGQDSLAERITPRPGAPACTAKARKYLTWIKPPAQVRPLGDGTVKEDAEWWATLRRMVGKGRYSVVFTSPHASAQIAGPGFKHPGVPDWGGAYGDYPDKISRGVKRRGRYRWMVTLTWQPFRRTVVTTKVPHFVEPGGARKQFCSFGG